MAVDPTDGSSQGDNPLSDNPLFVEPDEQNSDQLEAFLDAQEGEGSAHSEGSFTISRGQALEKLGSFQLPFPGAWALKAVQYGVASECEEIKVYLSRAESKFVFRGGHLWSLDQVEQALLDPATEPEPALAHLVSALRVVGFNQKRKFRLALCHQPESLIWDGESLETEPNETIATVLSVSNQALGESGGFFGFSTQSSTRHAEVTQVVTEQAHVCPIPLTLDGRRIDAFELNPRHGWGPESQLLMMEFRHVDDPPWIRIPEATRAHLAEPDVRQNTTLRDISEGLTEMQNQTRTTCGMVFLLSAHMKRVKKGKKRVWRDITGSACCNWVGDGIIVQSDSLGTKPDFCSAGMFLSAQGLATDLTGLRLRETELKNERLQQGRKHLAEGLAQVSKLDFRRAGEKAERESKSVGGTMVGLGLLFSLWTGIGGGALMMLGASIFFSGSGQIEERADQIYQSVDRLRAQLQE